MKFINICYSGTIKIRGAKKKKKKKKATQRKEFECTVSL